MPNCYFISCHRSYAQVRDLFRYIYRPEHFYLIHCDRKAPADLDDLVARIAAYFPNVRMLPSQACSWAGYSMMSITLGALRVALAEAPYWTHFFWISEQHLPLHDQASPRWQLAPGESYCDLTPLREMDQAGRADVLHRFSMVFRELPGIGSFGIRPISRDSRFLDTLHHGSNWLVLARAACDELLQRISRAGLTDTFAQSVHADETLLQTLLMLPSAEKRLPVNRWNPSFIAWPHLSGNQDLIFTPENLTTARHEGKLLIRKRPERLSPKLETDFETMAAFSVHELEQRLSSLGSSTRVASKSAPATALFNEIHAALPNLHSDHIFQLYDPLVLPNVPAFYMHIAKPETSLGLRLCILSEDLSNFKVLIAISVPGDGDFAPLHLGRLRAYPLRVRVFGLFMAREILLDTEHDSGFVLVAHTEQADALIHTVRRYAEQMLRIEL